MKNKSDSMKTNLLDVEAQTPQNDDTIKMNIPLKGILKSNNNIKIENEIIRNKLFKICSNLFVIVIIFPIMVCDLYFGFIDTGCSSEKHDRLFITLNLYLFVSGLITLITLITILLKCLCISKIESNNSKHCLGLVYSKNARIILLSLVSIIWNILGAIIFWGYLYKNGNCREKISTYVFVTLIIKLTISIFGITLNIKIFDH